MRGPGVEPSPHGGFARTGCLDGIFSRTVLESMLAGTPVVANGASAVVAWHLERSGAGLVYHDQAELSACLDFVADRPRAARALATEGARYVIDNYEPAAVFDRMVDSLDRWFPVDSARDRVSDRVADIPVSAGTRG